MIEHLDRQLPSAFVEEEPSIEDRIRARVIAGWFISILFMCALIFVICLGIHLFTYKDYSLVLVAVGSIAIVFAFQHYMFRHTTKVSNSATFFSMTFFAIVFATVLVTGSWDSPARQLLFCLPLISFLVGGKQEGIYMSTIILISGLGLMLSKQMGIASFQVILAHEIDTVGALIWVITLILVVSCLLIYDSLLHAYSRLAQQKKAL